jgi:hypothetical protein
MTAQKMADTKKPVGITQGTDQASAEKNLRLEYENLKKDQQMQKGYENYEKSKAKGMRKGGYVTSADGCAIRGKTRGKTL